MTEVLTVPSLFLGRQGETRTRLDGLADQLRVAGLLGSDDREIVGQPHLAIFATGSLGRREVGSRSDLDVFLVDAARGQEKPLSNLDSIVVRAQLIQAAQLAEFAPFSRDGEYLVVHRLEDVLAVLGTAQDDSTNVFTARMLLLLESEPLAGVGAYDRCVRDTIAVYSRDAHDAVAFRPLFLMNDLVRYWKTLCLNYEGKRHELHRAREQARGLRGEPGGAERLERVARLEVEYRIDVLKLRFNRLWTCFNGLAFLLAGAASEVVTREHVENLVALHPVARAEWVAAAVPRTAGHLQRALEAYASFLSLTDADKEQVVAALGDDATYRDHRQRSRGFGDDLQAVVDACAEQAGLRRFLLL